MVSPVRLTLLRNSIQNIIGYIYLLGASFISIPYIAHGLGSVGFAQYLILSAIPPALSVLDLGVSQAVIRYISATDDHNTITLMRRTSYLFFARLSVASIVITGIVTIALSRLHLGSFTFLTGVAIACAVGLNQLLSHFMSVAQAQNRFGVYNLKTYIVGTGNTIIPAFLAYRGFGLSEIFGALALSYAVTLIVVIRAVGSRNEREQKVPWDAEIFRQFIVFGLKGFLGRISGQIDLNAGKYVLISAPPASQITAFALPQSLVYRAAGLVTQTATAFFPLASSLSHPEKRKTLKSMYHTLQIMLFITAVCVAVFVYAYGDVFLNWWLKDPVLTSSTSLPFKIMSLFFILLSLSSLPSTIVDSLGHPEYTSYIAFSNSLLNISLLILLVPGRGAYGAALASLFALLITLPILLIVTEKLLKR